MSKATCLHIQDREFDPIRVVEIPWITVRIGRAAYCEVRLNNRGIPEEACRLLRRGETWSLVPLSSRGAVLVDGQPVLEARTLPFDVPFRIGQSVLTLQPHSAAAPDWGMFERRSKARAARSPQMPAGPSAPEWTSPGEAEGILAAASPDPSVTLQDARTPAHPVAATGPQTAPEPASPPPAAEPVNPWEARWKAAGARLRTHPPERPRVDRPSPTAYDEAANRYAAVPVKEPATAPPPRPAVAPEPAAPTAPLRRPEARPASSVLPPRPRTMPTAPLTDPSVRRSYPTHAPALRPRDTEWAEIRPPAAEPVAMPPLARTIEPTARPLSPTPRPAMPPVRPTPLTRKPTPIPAPAEPEPVAEPIVEIAPELVAEPTVRIEPAPAPLDLFSQPLLPQLPAPMAIEPVEEPAVDEDETPLILEVEAVAEAEAEAEFEPIEIDADEPVAEVPALAAPAEAIEDEPEPEAEFQPEPEPVVVEMVSRFETESEPRIDSEPEVVAEAAAVTDAVPHDVFNLPSDVFAAWLECYLPERTGPAPQPERPRSLPTKPTTFAPVASIVEIRPADPTAFAERLPEPEPAVEIEVETVEVAEAAPVELPHEDEAAVEVETAGPILETEIEPIAMVVEEVEPEPEAIVAGPLDEGAPDAPVSDGLAYDSAVVDQLWTPIWVTGPSSEVMADTSWPAPGEFAGEVFEANQAKAVPAPTATAAPEKPTEIRTATLLDSTAASDHANPAESAEWPRTEHPWGTQSRRREQASEPSEPEPVEDERDEPGNSRFTRFDFPSAKEILAALPSRPHIPEMPRPTPRAERRQAAPTEPHEPAQWLAPVWLGWPPALLLAVGLGVSGTWLSLRWTKEAQNVAVVSQRLLLSNGNAKAKPLPESVVPPSPSWLGTTSVHLAEWGAYLSRANDGEDHSAEAKALLDAAVQISPLDASARLAQAQLAAKTGESAELVKHLGLSRDASSLAWTARSLRAAGRDEAAIRAYHHALELASAVNLTDGPEPAFNDDPKVRRFLLPGETAATAIIREMASDPKWPVKVWATAVPPNTVAAIAAARFLQEQGRMEARPMLEAIVNTQAEPAANASRSSAALRLAITAEAQAMLSRWDEAEKLYRQAIDEIEDDTIKRSWWFNLAHVAVQLNDDTQRKAALQAALETFYTDDISRRALELQRITESGGRLRSNGTKAN